MNNLPPEFQSLARTLEGIELTNQTPTTATQTTPTMRDLFACAALSGIMARVANPTMPQGTRELVAKLSYQQADAMLVERERGRLQ